MEKKALEIYKIPLAISVTLAIVLIALGTLREPLDIAAAIVGSVFGTFVLDLEYYLYAYIIEPTKDFSKTLTSYINHKDITNAILYVDHHKNEITDKSLNSALFQIVIAGFSLFVVYSTRSVFAKALVLSILANSIYKLIELYLKSDYANWFWIMKIPPKKDTVTLYLIGVIALFAFCLYIF